MYRKFGVWFLRCVNGHTDTLIAIVRTPTGNVVTSPVKRKNELEGIDSCRRKSTVYIIQEKAAASDVDY